MGGFLARLRDRPGVTIHSPLSPDETLRRLRTGMTGAPVLSLDTGRERVGRRVVFGRVHGDRVRIYTQGVSSRHVQKILRARCVPALGGCDIVGAFALLPVAETLLLLLLGGSLAGFGWSAVHVVTDAVWQAPAQLAAMSLVVFVVAAGLICLNRLVEDRDERFLKAWIKQQLAPQSTLPKS